MNFKDKKLNLLNDFPPVPTEAWEAQIHKDLKGADYNKKLIWRTAGGLCIKPYYRAEDIKNLKHLRCEPGLFPYVRGNKQNDNDWEIRQDIAEEDINIANKIAVDAVERGAQGIGFRVKSLTVKEQMVKLLRYLELEKTAVHFVSAREYPFIMETFIGEMKLRGADKEKVKGSINFDPFSYYLLYDDFYNSLNDNLNEAVYLLTKIQDELPAFRMINVNGHFLHNAGGTVVEELAFTLASANEYLAKLIQKGLSVENIGKSMQFSFALGSSYFIEIAKIRAARLLWSAIVEQYHPATKEAASIHIHGITSSWNKTVYDPYVNMLRTTTEAMSGAIAGCNSISVNPFDNPIKPDDVFSRRIARNQQLILKEEAYLNKIIDPSAGSYYLENLTNIIAEEAWELFKLVESKGGFLKAVETGFIKERIMQSAEKQKERIAYRKQTILGTNQYPDAGVAMLDKMKKPVMKSYPGLNLQRAAMPFERLRMMTEQYVKEGNPQPKVFLLTMGDITMRKARASFAGNFFSCAGYIIVDSNGYSSVEEAVDAVLESEANIVVICSSDDAYAEIVPPITKVIKKHSKESIVVVAGNPVNIIQSLKETGVDHFIHVKTNMLASLQRFHEMIGIK